MSLLDEGMSFLVTCCLLQWKPLIVIMFVPGQSHHYKRLVTITKLCCFSIVPDLEGKVTVVFRNTIMLGTSLSRSLVLTHTLTQLMSLNCYSLNVDLFEMTATISTLITT